MRQAADHVTADDLRAGRASRSLDGAVRTHRRELPDARRVVGAGLTPDSARHPAARADAGVGRPEPLVRRSGDHAGFAVHDIEVSSPDVVAIRSKTGLSQTVFARSIGIPLGTLKNWEQARRRPEGPGARAARAD